MDSTLNKRRWNIMGTTYITKWVDELKDENGNEVSGQIDFLNKEILLCSSLLQDVRSRSGLRYALKTLVHELLHGVHEESGMHQTDIDDNLFEIMAESGSNFIVNSFKLEPIEDY